MNRLPFIRSLSPRVLTVEMKRVTGIFSLLAVGLAVVVVFVYLDVKSVKQPRFAPIVQLSGGKVRGIVAKVGANEATFLYSGIRYGDTLE